jgi:hypothetical protein
MPCAVRSPAVGNSTGSPTETTAGSSSRLDERRTTVQAPLARSIRTSVRNIVGEATTAAASPPRTARSVTLVNGRSRATGPRTPAGSTR